MERTTWKYLQDRLKKAKNEKLHSVRGLPLPAEVKKAKNTIKTFDKVSYEVVERKRALIHKAACPVEEAIILGDVAKVLTLLKSFEKKRF